MKVYISLPISNRDENEAREHADLQKAMLSRSGHTPVNPFEIYHGKHATYADILCKDLRALADCDAIYLCDSWQFSRGCRIEAMFAQEFGKQIMYETAPERDHYYFNH